MYLCVLVCKIEKGTGIAISTVTCPHCMDKHISYSESGCSSMHGYQVGSRTLAQCAWMMQNVSVIRLATNRLIHGRQGMGWYELHMQQQEPHIQYHRTSPDLQLAIILREFTVTVGVRMFGLHLFTEYDLTSLVISSCTLITCGLILGLLLMNN